MDTTTTTPAKGERGGECNRSACTNTDSQWWNHATKKHYCKECALRLNTDPYNMREASYPLCSPRFPEALSLEHLERALPNQSIVMIIYEYSALEMFSKTIDRRHPDDKEKILGAYELLKKIMKEKGLESVL